MAPAQRADIGGQRPQPVRRPQGDEAALPGQGRAFRIGQGGEFGMGPGAAGFVDDGEGLPMALERVEEAELSETVREHEPVQTGRRIVVLGVGRGAGAGVGEIARAALGRDLAGMRYSGMPRG